MLRSFFSALHNATNYGEVLSYNYKKNSIDFLPCGVIKTKIYVDVLVVINIFINYFLLSAASLIVRLKPKRIRLAAGAFTGGAYSLVIFLPNIPNILSVFMNFCMSVLLVLIAFAPKKITVFIKEFAAFFAVNFIFAGLMLAVWLVFKPSGMVYNNAAVYFDIDVKLLVLSTVVCYVVLTLFSKLLKRNSPDDKLFDVKLCNKGAAVFTKALFDTGNLKAPLKKQALFDTGNLLSDGFSDTPVIIAERSVVKKLVPEGIFSFIDGEAALPINADDGSIRLIPAGTVGGESILRAVLIDSVTVIGKKEAREVKNVILAESKTPFSSGDYSVLLGPKIFEIREGNQKNERAKKTAGKD